MRLLDLHNRHIIGAWLHRYRKWGLVPLLAVGLIVSVREMPLQYSGFMMIAGAVGILFGTILRIVCYTFVGAKDPVLGPNNGGLATEGPYAITRNPVYLAEGAIVLGIAMMSRMPWFVVVTFLLGGIVTSLVIEWEEDMLRQRYGAAFHEYSRHVPRWFSLRRFVHPDSYFKTRGRVQLWQALRAESMTLLIGLLAILAFLAKADFDIIF